MPAPKGQENFDKMEELQIGQGNKTVKADEQGFWIGHQSYDRARFRISMEGTMIYNDGTNDRILMGEDPNPAPIS